MASVRPPMGQSTLFGSGESSKRVKDVTSNGSYTLENLYWAVVGDTLDEWTPGIGGIGNSNIGELGRLGLVYARSILQKKMDGPYNRAPGEQAAWAAVTKRFLTEDERLLLEEAYEPLGADRNGVLGRLSASIEEFETCVSIIHGTATPEARMKKDLRSVIRQLCEVLMDEYILYCYNNILQTSSLRGGLMCRECLDLTESDSPAR